jgi:hypothetical protein
VFPDMQSGGGIEEVGTVEEGADAAGRGFYLYRACGDEVCCELFEAVICQKARRERWGSGLRTRPSW